MMDAQVTPSRTMVALVDALASPANDFRARSEGFEAQRIDHGVAILRERFQTAEGRLGDPSILVSSAGYVGLRAVGLVTRPVSGPEIAAIAGRLLGEGLLDALVIAGVDEGSSPDRAPQATARSVARALAYRGEGGLVIELRAAPEGTPAIARSAQALDSIPAFTSAADAPMR